MAIKTEHSGHKGSGRKGGYWGKRAEAKQVSKKLRRENGKRQMTEEEIYDDDFAAELAYERAANRC